jgi:hypothetical protein
VVPSVPMEANAAMAGLLEKLAQKPKNDTGGVDGGVDGQVVTVHIGAAKGAKPTEVPTPRKLVGKPVTSLAKAAQ